MRLLLALCLLFPQSISSSPGFLRRKAYYFNTPATPEPTAAEDESELLSEIEQLEESLGLQDNGDGNQALNATSPDTVQVDATGKDDQEMTSDLSAKAVLDSPNEDDLDETADDDLEGGDAEISSPSEDSTYTMANLTDSTPLDVTTRSADRSSTSEAITLPDLGSTGAESPIPAAETSPYTSGLHPYSPMSMGNPETNPDSTSAMANLTELIPIDATTRSADRSSTNEVISQPGLGSTGEENPIPAEETSPYASGLHPYSPTATENPEATPTEANPYASLRGSSAFEENSPPLSPYGTTQEAPTEGDSSAGSAPTTFEEPAAEQAPATDGYSPLVEQESPDGYGSPTSEQTATSYSSSAEEQSSGYPDAASNIEQPIGYEQAPAGYDGENPNSSVSTETIEQPVGYGAPTSEQTPVGYGSPAVPEIPTDTTIESPDDPTGISPLGSSSYSSSESSTPYGSSRTIEPPYGQGTSESSAATSVEGSASYGTYDEPADNAEFVGDDTDDVEEEEQGTDMSEVDLPWKDQDWANKTPKEVADLAEAEALRMMEDKYVPLIVVAMSIVSMAFTLFVAQQMVENPNGVIAKFCRCMVAIARIISYPFRMLLCCCSGSSGRSRIRDRRTHEVLRNRSGEFS